MSVLDVVKSFDVVVGGEESVFCVVSVVVSVDGSVSDVDATKSVVVVVSVLDVVASFIVVESVGSVESVFVVVSVGFVDSVTVVLKVADVVVSVVAFVSDVDADVVVVT